MTARSREEEAGYSLPELLIAMALTSVLLALLAGVFLSNLNTTSRISAKADSTADARLVADTMARRLRVAVRPDGIPAAFVGPLAPDRVTFYASIAGGALGGPAPGEQNVTPTRVEYQVASVTRDGQPAQCLQETLTPGTGSKGAGGYPASGAIRRCLAYGQFNLAGTPMLSYLTSGTGTTPAISEGQVRAVRIAVTITSARGGQTAATTATTQVSLPNVCQVGELSC